MKAVVGKSIAGALVAIAGACASPPRTPSVDATRTIVTTVHVDAAPERVVDAFRQQADLAAWWKVTRANVDDRVDGLWTVVWEEGTTDRATYVWSGRILVSEPRRLVFGDLVHIEPHRQIFAPLELEIVAEPEADGARLTVTHRGYRRGGDWDWFHAAVVAGWRNALRDLGAWFALSPGTAGSMGSSR